MKYKVAEFITVIADGGAESIIKDYACMLDKNKFDTIVIARRTYKDSVNVKVIKENGGKVISIYKNNCFPMKVIQKLNDWWYVPYKIKQILIREKVDICHMHLNTLGYIKKISKHIKNVKLFYTCHSDPKKHHISTKKSQKNARYLIKQNGMQMIALHEDMRKEINNILKINNTVVIRNGIDFIRFKNITESRQQLRNSIGIPENAFVIGHVGRFVDVKNHIFLADIFAELCRRKENAFLLMIGSGELKDQTELKLNSFGLKDKYVVLSHRTDIPQLMKSMDVFVFPSLYEGLPVTLVEAQVSGLRCIIADTINEESILSENTISISLDKSADEWCDVILDESIKGQPNRNIEDYDMNKEIKKLEQLYMGEIND